ncbi:hypothetical protein J3F83DRAFT_240126 [Trichoderma novae-zelandiae]
MGNCAKFDAGGIEKTKPAFPHARYQLRHAKASMPLPQANAIVCDQARRLIKEFLGRGMGFTPLRQGGLGREGTRPGRERVGRQHWQRWKVIDGFHGTANQQLAIAGAAFNAPDAVVKLHLSQHCSNADPASYWRCQGALWNLADAGAVDSTYKAASGTDFRGPGQLKVGCITSPALRMHTRTYPWLVSDVGTRRKEKDGESGMAWHGSLSRK